MELIFGQPEHTDRLLAGFNNLFGGENLDATDTKYLNTCLRLNGVDMSPQVAGNEGFVETLKAAGVKFYEMVKKLLKMIRDFFFGSNGAKADAAVAKASVEVKEAIKAVQAKEKLPEFKPAQELVDFIETKLDNLYDPVQINIRAINDRYSGHTDNYFKTIEGVAKKLGKTLPDFEADMQTVSRIYDELEKMLSRGKDGQFNGVVSTLDEASAILEKTRALRGAYQGVLTKLTRATDEFNELGHHKGGGEKKSIDRVTGFLAKFTNDISRALDSTTKMISRLHTAVMTVTKRYLGTQDMIQSRVDLDEFMGYTADV